MESTGRIYKGEGVMMAGPSENLPQISPADKTVTVLAVSPHHEDHACLRGIFSQSNWKIFGVQSYRDAVRFLHANRISVVVSEASLPDGDWKLLFRSLSNVKPEPLLVVASQKADHGVWADVLNLGAYDVLSKPFDRAEVTRIISLAWLHWKESQSPALKRSIGRAAASASGAVYSALA